MLLQLTLQSRFFRGQLFLQIVDNRRHFSGRETAEIGCFGRVIRRCFHGEMIAKTTP
jgi:hypothetical protein